MNITDGAANAQLPLVSIVTIVYNGERYLADCINSVRKQSYPNIEYIIIDGGSTDNTLSIIKNNEDIVTRFVSELDDGISDAFNKGIFMANGELIGLINSDDHYEPDTISNVVAFYLKNEKATGVYFGNVRYFNSTLSYTLAPNLSKIWKYMSIFHPATFVSKIVYDTLGGYALDYKYAMDCEFVHRALHHQVKFYQINKILSNFRLEGKSDENHKKSLQEFFRSVKTYKSGYFFATYYYYWGLLKKSIVKTSLGKKLNNYRDQFWFLFSGNRLN